MVIRQWWQVCQIFSQEGSEKGGLVIYLDTKFRFKIIHKLNEFEHWEGQMIRVSKGGLPNSVIVCNRPAKLGRVKTSRFTRKTSRLNATSVDVRRREVRDARRCDKYTCIPVLSKKVGNSL